MRGLKLNTGVGAASGLLSHLLQMRGLKPDLSLEAVYRVSGVASFTDAWIETRPHR